MLLATWNVNSVRARLPRLVAWLERRAPEVVCLQETKAIDEEFPRAELAALGYRCTTFGQKTYNGVAILTRSTPTEVAFGLPGDTPEAERRFVAVTVAGVRVASVYVPNGREVGHPAYEAKLAWLARLHDWIEASLEQTTALVVAGDFNIAPEDRDVWDVALWEGKNLFSEPEKAAFRRLLAAGLVDTVRQYHPAETIFTWWDYRQGAFHRGWGMRLDHILASRPLAARCTWAAVDRDERKGEGPSDHVPVLAAFDGL